MPAGQSAGAVAGHIPSQAVLSCPSPKHIPSPVSQQAPSPGVPSAGGLLAQRGARLQAGAAAAFHVCPPPQPGSRSLFQQVPVISG